MVKADSVYSEVKKCIDDMFFLKPTPEIRNIIRACLGRAQKKYPLKIYWVDANVDHLHRGRAPYEDLESNMSDFDQYFFSLLTREINTFVGRKGGGTIWAGRNRAEECVDAPSLEQQLFYVVTTMVKDGLLDRAAHNPGFGTYHAIASGDMYERFWYIDRTAWHRAGGEQCEKPLSAFKKWVTVEYPKIPTYTKGPKVCPRYASEPRVNKEEYTDEYEFQVNKSFQPSLVVLSLKSP